jgi:hypothetical protein
MMSVGRPIIVLLTDFGTRDFYVGAMKGAVLRVCPDAQLVDLGHEIARHDVDEAAFALAAAYRTFPAGSVFLAVVDPGVGSARRPLALDAGGCFFVGPDNGVFTALLDAHPEARARELTNAALLGPRVSRTFHGRDVFAPVAGYLACGGAFENVGRPLLDPQRLVWGAARESAPGEWDAAVLHRDRFGNLTTQLLEAQLEGLLVQVGGDRTAVLVRAAGRVLPLVDAYADVGVGEPCAIVGSAGRLELAVNQGDAGQTLGLARGDSVRVALRRRPD